MSSRLSNCSGLAEDDINLIVETLKEHPNIRQAKLFGSRAKGNFKAGSDVDIALFFNPKEDKNARRKTVCILQDKLEESLPLSYFFDLIDFATIKSAELKEHIDRVGISIFDRNMEKNRSEVLGAKTSNL